MIILLQTSTTIKPITTQDISLYFLIDKSQGEFIYLLIFPLTWRWDTYVVDHDER